MIAAGCSHQGARHEPIKPIQKPMVVDADTLSVELRFQFGPAAKPDIGPEVEEALKVRIWINAVNEAGTFPVGSRNVQQAVCVTNGNRAFVAVLFPVEQRRSAHGFSFDL
jgi:hypothetical protein